MISTTRHVRDIDTRDRQALEHVLGQPLQDGQTIIIQVVPSGAESDSEPATVKLPAWCAVYAGLSESEIAQVEKIVLGRSDLCRDTE